MSDLEREEEIQILQGFEKLSTEDLKYHYSPVPSNCMACAARSTSRKRKELEVQNSDVLCGPFPSSEDICHSPQTLAREKYRRSQLRIVTTNKRIKVFGEWTEERLTAVVTDRLLQRATSLPPPTYKKIPLLGMHPLSVGVPYDPIIHRGIYGERILRKLYRSGASNSVLIRAMKFGLRHLGPEDLDYFVQFGVSIPVLRSRKLWKELTDESLLTPLRTMGFDEEISRKIILTGMLSQNETCLIQMMLAGADVPGILNWQGPAIEVGIRMIQFFRKLGIPNDVIQLVVQKGVDEETHEMLKDLGYTETEKEEHPGMHEVVLCECDLTVFESEESSLTQSLTCGNNSTETLLSEHEVSQVLNDIKIPETCTCLRSSISNPSSSSHRSLVSCRTQSSELLVGWKDYLRKTVMIPLAWAMAKALEYRPSDPKYYIACQLVRWRNGGVSKAEMKGAEDFVITRTIEMDKKLIEEKQKVEEENIAKRNKEALENIPCHPCRQQQQAHRVKEGCWKCARKWVPNYEPCEFPETCSCCKVDLSHILNSGRSTTSREDIRSRNIPDGGEGGRIIVDSRQSGSSSDIEIEESSYHRDSNVSQESIDSRSQRDDIKQNR